MTGSSLAPVGNAGNSPVYIDMGILGDCKTLLSTVKIVQFQGFAIT